MGGETKLAVFIGEIVMSKRKARKSGCAKCNGSRFKVIVEKRVRTQICENCKNSEKI